MSPWVWPRARVVILISAIVIAMSVSACGDRTASPQSESAPQVDSVSSVSSVTASDTVDRAVNSPSESAPGDGAGVSVTTSVASQLIVLVDESRSVVSDGRTMSSTRSLPTTVWRPDREGRFPLIIFAHGYRLGPPGYARFCETLARAGYIVAAPSFPLADESRGIGLDRDDIPSQAVDVSFVIGSLRAGPIGAVIDPGPVGVAGHSDGADVALIVGYEQGFADAAIGAVVAIAPDAFTGPLASSRPPLLLIHADADRTVPYSESVQVFGRVRSERFLLTLRGADHLPPIAEETVWTSALDGATVTFFDATLKNVQSLASAQRLMQTLALTTLDHRS